MCVRPSTDFVTKSSLPTDREPSNDSSPTETCVCVHCFPDLKALGQGHDRPPKAPLSFYPQAVLHRAQIQNGEPLWTEGNLYTSGPEVQDEAAVGWSSLVVPLGQLEWPTVTLTDRRRVSVSMLDCGFCHRKWFLKCLDSEAEYNGVQGTWHVPLCYTWCD